MTFRLQPTNAVVVHLDRETNPFAPVTQVADAISGDDGRWPSTEALRDTVMDAIALDAGVQRGAIALANGIDEMHAMIARWRSEHGPLVSFPPTDPYLASWIGQFGGQVEEMSRGNGFRIPVRKTGVVLPGGATSVVLSPNAISGTILPLLDAVALLRRSALLVVDERHGRYSPRTLVPLVREWDNLVVLGTIELWGGLEGAPLAWAIAPLAAAAEIRARERPSGISRLALVGALAAFTHRQAIDRTLRQVAVEKGRLYRQIRKLNMISAPYPSWSGTLLCRFERGSSAFFVPKLAERGIRVYQPPQANLREHVRIAAVSAEATYALKHALIDIALELDDGVTKA